MKKLLFVLALAPTLVLAEAKVATVDLLLMVRNHKNYEANRELLTSTDKDYQKKLEAIKAEGEKVQEEGKKLAEQLRNPMLAPKAKGEIEDQLMKIQQQLVGIEQRYRSEMMRSRQELQDLEGRLLKTTTEDIRKQIKKYAKANGIKIVLDKSTIPYADDSLEITDQLLEAAGIDPKAARAKQNESK